MEAIHLDAVEYKIENKIVLKNVSCQISQGSFVALLGENGSGKTTLIDLMMGFRKPSSGTVRVKGEEPHLDPWQSRQSMAYLSEKVDIPGDWLIREFLDFNAFFYPKYDHDLELRLAKIFKVQTTNVIGNLSAGEIRRAQIVGALSTHPNLIFVDEITAVLDIVGRQRFFDILTDLNRRTGCTIFMATNIMEGLASHLTHAMIIKDGRIAEFDTIASLIGKDKSIEEFSRLIAEKIENA